MKTQKMIVIAAIVCLLVGVAGIATARVVSGWFVVGLESASDTVAVESSICAKATSELINMGFKYMTMTHIEPRLAALFFIKRSSADDPDGDNAALFCLANVIEEQLGNN